MLDGHGEQMEETLAMGARGLDQAQTAPDDVDIWLQGLEKASTDEERLFYLSRIQALEPQNARARQLTARMMKGYLRKQPFLAYLEENSDLYKVRTANDLILVVAKDRAIPETYSPQRFGPFGQAYRNVMLAILGLVLSGPIALVFGLLSMAAALRAVFLTQGRARVRAPIIILIALLILLPALVLSYLLWLHVVS
jgi:hypothetical protein